MIVTERGEEFILFTQPDHAALAAALMELWRLDRLPEHPRRKELLLAIREHDNGWREADAAPRADPASGRPLTFREVKAADRLEIWRRGVHRFEADRPFVALLILRHAIEIHPDRWSSAGWEECGQELGELATELRKATGISRSELQNDYRFVEIADTLSLGACGAMGPDLAKGAIGGYRFEVELGRVALAPFPLAGATTLEIAYRTLGRRPFESDAHLAAELAVATWARLPVHIEPL